MSDQQPIPIDLDEAVSPELSAMFETRDALVETLIQLGDRIASLLQIADVGPTLMLGSDGSTRLSFPSGLSFELTPKQVSFLAEALRSRHQEPSS